MYLILVHPVTLGNVVYLVKLIQYIGLIFSPFQFVHLIQLALLVHLFNLMYLAYLVHLSNLVHLAR